MQIILQKIFNIISSNNKLCPKENKKQNFNPLFFSNEQEFKKVTKPINFQSCPINIKTKQNKLKIKSFQGELHINVVNNIELSDRYVSCHIGRFRKGLRSVDWI